MSAREDLPKGTVPNLVGQTESNAATQVTNAGFIVGSVTYSSIDDADGAQGTGNLDKVISQVETANSAVPLGVVIDYTVATPYFPPFFPPHFPPFFPPFFPPHFPPFFPPHFPPHFPPFFPPFFPPAF